MTSTRESSTTYRALCMHEGCWWGDDGQPNLPSGDHAELPLAASVITWCDSGLWWRRARSRRYLTQILPHGSDGQRRTNQGDLYTGLLLRQGGLKPAHA